MESSVLVQPKRPDWHKHEQMQIHHSKSMPFSHFKRITLKMNQVGRQEFFPEREKE
jgi:hypothetical protein